MKIFAFLYIGALQASTPTKASFKRSEGESSHSLRHEGQQENDTTTTMPRDRQHCTPEKFDEHCTHCKKGEVEK